VAAPRGNANATTHGAHSPAQIAAKARAHRRRFLRRAGLRAADLDAVAAELLGHWARGVAQLDLREAGGADSGKDYWTSYNAVKRALVALERRLRELGLDPARNGDRDRGGLEELIAAGRAIRERRDADGDDA